MSIEHEGAAVTTAIGAATTLRHDSAYRLLLALMGVALAVSGAPTPLYSTYEKAWQLSPLTITALFATYAVAALSAIVVAGPLTDALGRKPALVGSGVGMFAGLVMFVVAHQTWELFVARAIHGASIGTAVVAGAAAMLDLRPTEGDRTGRLTGIFFAAGMGLGILVSALLADHAPDALVTPYAVLGLLMVGVTLALTTIPETHRVRRTHIHVARPHVPGPIGNDFRFAVLSAGTSWVLIGMYLSLFPGLATGQVGLHGHTFGAVVVAAMMLSAAAAQAVVGRHAARPLGITGVAVMAVGVLLSVPAVRSGHAGLIVGSAVVLGVGFGLAFSGALRHLASVLPADARGGVMSAFYICCYSAMALPAVAAGWAASRWDLDGVYSVFAAAVAVVCLAGAGLGIRLQRSGPVASPLAVEVPALGTCPEAT
jgi:MFS family permease